MEFSAIRSLLDKSRRDHTLVSFALDSHFGGKFLVGYVESLDEHAFEYRDVCAQRIVSSDKQAHRFESLIWIESESPYLRLIEAFFQIQADLGPRNKTRWTRNAAMMRQAFAWSLENQEIICGEFLGDPGVRHDLIVREIAGEWITADICNVELGRICGQRTFHTNFLYKVMKPCFQQQLLAWDFKCARGDFTGLG